MKHDSFAGGSQFYNHFGPDPADATWLSEYEFLLVSESDREAVLDANIDAARCGVPLPVALTTTGRIDQDRYTTALASHHRVIVADDRVTFRDIGASAQNLREIAELAKPIFGHWRGIEVAVFCATVQHPDQLARATALLRRRNNNTTIAYVTSRALDLAIERNRSTALLKFATSGLKKRLPQFSAGRPAAQWQILASFAFFGLCMGGLIVEPRHTLSILSVLLMVPFAGTVAIRLSALLRLTLPVKRRQKPLRRRPDHDLPVYSILVALFDESRVLPSLIAALSRLDYPPAKLDCLLILEEVDSATKLAFLQADLPPWMRIVIVPEGQPRTKPRALNYALKLAKGEYVVVYDAEDRPDPDQLRRALAAFEESGPELACVQACLNIFNVRQNWLTRQFTVEYSALFDAVLPALQALRLPIPLGGTSNHFRRSLLDLMQGWDPYNVTEDADLGIRIARLGRRVTMIGSTTWEEAPRTFPMWLRQRTRWLKGWMQTYLVHTRQPLKLLQELGVFRTLGFHLYLGGLILSTLIHPLFYVALAADALFDLQSVGYGAGFGRLLWIAAVVNLALGYTTSILIGLLSTRRRGHRLALSALLMPIYWLLISLAAYRALWQLYDDPFLWEKTPHGLADED